MARNAQVAARAYKELTLQQLRSFHTVCRVGSYAAASEVLYLTPPAVWEQMQSLERHYGASLLERTGHGMQPTSTGRRLLELTRPLLAGLDSSRDVLRQELGAWPEAMTLSTNLRVFAAEISQGFGRFQNDHPNIRLKLEFLRDAQLMQSVLRGESDVAVTLEPGPAGLKPGLTHEVVGEVDYLLVAPRKHPLASVARLRLNHITKYPLVLGDEVSHSRQRVQEVFHRHHLVDAMSVAVETNSDEYSTFCVRAGMGVAITVGTPAAGLYRGLHARALRHWFGSVRVGLAWKEGAVQSPAQQELARRVVAFLKPTSSARSPG